MILKNLPIEKNLGILVLDISRFTSQSACCLPVFCIDKTNFTSSEQSVKVFLGKVKVICTSETELTKNITISLESSRNVM